MTAPKAFPRVALDLATTVERIQQNFVICDPNLPDCPIVFASDGFIELTEYPRHEILGRNCRYATCGCAPMLITVIVYACMNRYSDLAVLAVILNRRRATRLCMKQCSTFASKLHAHNRTGQRVWHYPSHAGNCKICSMRQLTASAHHTTLTWVAGFFKARTQTSRL